MSMKKEVRDFCAYIILYLDVLAPYLDRKFIKKAVSRIRKLTTTPEAKYPKLEEIIVEIRKIDIKETVKLAKFEPLYAKEAIAVLKHVLEYPKFYNDNYDDIHPKLDKEGRPMMNFDQYRGFRLNEVQNDQNSNDPFVTAELSWKQTEKEYKKYVKEWRKKNGTD